MEVNLRAWLDWALVVLVDVEQLSCLGHFVDEEVRRLDSMWRSLENI